MNTCQTQVTIHLLDKAKGGKCSELIPCFETLPFGEYVFKVKGKVGNTKTIKGTQFWVVSVGWSEAPIRNYSDTRHPSKVHNQLVPTPQ